MESSAQMQITRHPDFIAMSKSRDWGKEEVSLSESQVKHVAWFALTKYLHMCM